MELSRSLVSSWCSGRLNRVGYLGCSHEAPSAAYPRNSDEFVGVPYFHVSLGLRLGRTGDAMAAIEPGPAHCFRCRRVSPPATSRGLLRSFNSALESLNDRCMGHLQHQQASGPSAQKVLVARRDPCLTHVGFH